MRRWLNEVASGLSRTLNAILGGDGDTTLSARAWAEEDAGSRGWGLLRMLIDGVAWLFGDPDHSRRAWEWHRDHGLLVED